MKRLIAQVCSFVAVIAAAATLSSAQPKLVFAPAADLTADGNNTLGTILDPNVDALIMRYTRGTGFTQYGPPLPSLDGSLKLADDFSAVSAALYNGLYSPQNPTFGNYTPTTACCVGNTCTMVAPTACTGTAIAGTSCQPTTCPASTDPGALGACCNLSGNLCTITTRAACASPNYWMGRWTSCGTNPCKHGHFVAHRFNTVTGTWQSSGSFPNVAGQGAAVCDSTINTPYGFSSTGRFTTGGAWFGPYGTTSCSMRGFLHDAQDGSVRQLPLIGTGCQPFSQGEHVSTDGLVVLGSDSHQTSDPDGTGPLQSICNGRTVTVWTRASTSDDFTAAGRTVLDDYGAGGLGAAAMNRAGTIIATAMSREQAVALGNVDQAANLHKRVRNLTTGGWDRITVGRCVDREQPCSYMSPLAISDDGNTIIGYASYDDGGPGSHGFFSLSRPFIWKAGVNGGVPIDLQDYLRSINGGQPFPPTGAITGVSANMSADGNAFVVAWAPPAPESCPANTGLQGLPRSAILYLDGASIPCEPPRIAGGPYDRIQSEYTIFGIVGNVFFAGSYPMTAEWQKETPSGSNNWVTLTDSCGVFAADESWVYEGTSGFQLRVNMLAPPAQRDGRYRVRLTNSCGSAVSQVANIGVVSGACCWSNNGVVTCTIELPTRCTGSPVISYFRGGIYLGDNSTCAPTTCDAVSGACCFGGGGPNASCVLTIATHCTELTGNGGLGGSFVGAGTACSPASCALVSGACCYSTSNTSNVICTSEVQAHCSRSAATGGLSGAFITAGSTCGPTSCSTVAGACCYAPDSGSDVICTIQTQTRCTNLPSNPSVQGYVNGLQGIYVGAGSTCLPLNQQCGFVAGACCYSLDDTSNAVCTLQLSDRCTRAKNNSGLGGTYRGDGTTCTPTSCTTVTGACCYSTFANPDVLLCTIQPLSRCTNRFNAGGLFGVYLGGGTTCSPTACTNSVGACCYIDATGCLSCALTPGATRCTDPVNGGLGGTYAGNNTTCSPTSCPSDGACCVTGSCSITCQSICELNAGTFLGVGTTCSPDPCNAAVGACCRGTTCLPLVQIECAGVNSSFGGPGTTCNVFGVNNTTPCCLADFNHIGGVTVQDIFDFLAAYFSQNNAANINGGSVTVQDIFDFLSAYFGGC